METKKTLIICQSIHHGNTTKIAGVIADVLEAKVKKPFEVSIEELANYDLIGFGSGIYDDMHHTSLLELVDKLPNGAGKKTFIFSTSGVPVSVFGDKFLQNYLTKAHSKLRNKLEAKHYEILGDFICPGFNTNVFLKYFGGINKSRPNQKDFENAKEFALKMKNGL
ncbi:MAG: flavodoxin family protein [Candidatus Moraniibacteriota bacterium]